MSADSVSDSVWDNLVVVASSENTPYMAWQTRLLAYSVITKLKVPFLAVVHRRDPLLHRYFEEIRTVGGEVLEAPSYRGFAGGDHPSLNGAGSLIRAARRLRGTVKYIYFIDQDFIFTRRPTLPDSFAAEAYTVPSMIPTHEDLRILGIDKTFTPNQLQRFLLGKPYLIPVSRAEELGKNWLSLAVKLHKKGNRWDHEMTAFNLSARKMFGPIRQTHCGTFNIQGWKSDRSAIHYGYPNDSFDKRKFRTHSQAEDVFHLKPLGDGSVQDEVFRQLNECEAWFRRKLPKETGFEMFWHRDHQWMSVDGERFEHPKKTRTTPMHDLAHLANAWNGGLLWKPSGTVREISLAELAAVATETFLSEAIRRKLYGQVRTTAQILDHLRNFVEVEYAPFPESFDKSLSDYLSRIKLETLVTFAPAFLEAARLTREKDHPPLRLKFGRKVEGPLNREDRAVSEEAKRVCLEVNDLFTSLAKQGSLESYARDHS